jgi:hypothetical protein
VGDAVSRVAVGDRVAATFRQGWVDGAGHSADAARDLVAALTARCASTRCSMSRAWCGSRST